jgi:hypothetical protein
MPGANQGSTQELPPERMPLEHAASTTHAVAADVQSASDDLLVINTVLEQELPDELQVGEVAQAIEHTGQLEKKLAESAESLAEVHAALKVEIEKRKAVTAERDAKQALVDKLKNEQSRNGSTGG